MANGDVVSEKANVKRGKKRTFGVLGVPVGSELIFKNNSEIRCVTVDAVNLVEKDGERFSLSALASKINGYPSSGFEYFTYGGRVLSRLQGSPVSEPGGSLPDSQPVDPGSLEFGPEVAAPDLTEADDSVEDPFNI